MPEHKRRTCAGCGRENMQIRADDLCKRCFDRRARERAQEAREADDDRATDHEAVTQGAQEMVEKHQADAPAQGPTEYAALMRLELDGGGGWPVFVPEELGHVWRSQGLSEGHILGLMELHLNGELALRGAL